MYIWIAIFCLLIILNRKIVLTHVIESNLLKTEATNQTKPIEKIAIHRALYLCKLTVTTILRVILEIMSKMS